MKKNKFHDFKMNKQKMNKQKVKRETEIQKQKRMLEERTLEFLKCKEALDHELQEIKCLNVELEEHNGGDYDLDLDYVSWEDFNDDDSGIDPPYDIFDEESYDPSKHPELPEMEMEPDLPKEKDEEFERLSFFVSKGVEIGPDSYKSSDIAPLVAKYFKPEEILIVEEEVEKHLEQSFLHFPKNPMFYANGIAISTKPISKKMNKFNMKFKYSLEMPNFYPIRRRTFVFGKNPKTKKKLSVPGAYILLDERKYIVGYEFDRNFQGNPIGQNKKSDVNYAAIWGFRGIENGIIDFPFEYLTMATVERLSSQGYVFFPSPPHMSNMSLEAAKKLKIRDDGLAKVEDLIPGGELGPDGQRMNQTYLFTQPGLTYSLPPTYWDGHNVRFLDSFLHPFLRIIIGTFEGRNERRQTRGDHIMGYRVERPPYLTQAQRQKTLHEMLQELEKMSEPLERRMREREQERRMQELEARPRRDRRYPLDFD
jgi:hypothetical protein